MKFHQNNSQIYHEMKHRRQRTTFQFQEGPFAKSARGRGKSFYEVLFSRKVLQTKPQVESMKTNYSDLFFLPLLKV